jgi:hypothetical protein
MHLQIMGMLRWLVSLLLYLFFIHSDFLFFHFAGMQNSEYEQLPPHILQEIKNNGEDEVASVKLWLFIHFSI